MADFQTTMPPTRRQRHAARLAVRHPPRLKIMENEGPITRGRAANGRSRGTTHGRGATTGHAGQDPTKFQVKWQADPSRIDRLVQHLLAHPADCRVLFFSNAIRSHPDGDIPSGKDKQEVCRVIAGAVFKDDQEYAALYLKFPGRFRDSTLSQIGE